MKKQLIVAGVATTLGIAGLSGAAIAHAETKTSSDPMSSLASAIASKFNLKQSDVQAVLDEQRTKMDEDYETKAKMKVTELVKAGSLTKEQGDAINAKRAELKKQHESENNQDKSSQTKDQRKSDMESRKNELDTWLKEKGIDTKYAYLLMDSRSGHHSHGEAGSGRRSNAENNT